MPRRLLVLVAALCCLLAVAAPSDAARPKHVPKAVPSPSTPNVKNGRVYAVTKVGDTVVIGGTFSRIASPSGSQTLNRSFVAAFDASTGAVPKDFSPNLNGAVLALSPAR